MKGALQARLSGRAVQHHSTAFLTSMTSLKIALLVLNGDTSCSGAHGLFDFLWQQSALRLCADGAANRLHDSTTEPRRGAMLPDVITGDLDSLRADVADYYSTRGVPIKAVADQDTNDFQKCLRWLQQRQEMGHGELLRRTGSDGTAGPHGAGEDSEGLAVVAYGAFGGRLDQQMANLNMVYTYDCFRDFYLVSEHSLAFLLRPGTHVIECNRQAEDGTCGLIPLGARCDHVRTTGLEWDLDGSRALEFGSLISSSNQVVDDRATVETDSPLLWTTGLRQGDIGLATPQSKL